MRLPFLQNHGVLGLNARNLLYIKPLNPRKAVAFADDKMKTKAFLSARGIPTARLFARIESRRQLSQFDFSTLPEECVLKPNYGFGGEGIIILKGRRNGMFLEQGKKPVSDQELREHIEDILDGKFSVNGHADTAFFEQILVADDCFIPFRPAGLPDLRIVVFNLVPVMAMLRVPTAQSGGKANVHLGGLGIGLDIAKGVTTHAAQYNRIIHELPHGFPVAGTALPNWEEILLISSRIQQMTNIGYLAVDLTIDKELGPVLLEVNARAGLMVQVANLAPLRARLERVEGLKVSSPEKGVRIAQELFGEKVKRRQSDMGNKPILAPREIVEFSLEDSTIEELSAIAPEQEHTVFAEALLKELQDADGLETVDGSPGSYKVKFSLSGKKIQTLVHSGDTTAAGVRAVIGRRDLAGFLIDPSRKPSAATPRTTVKVELRAADRLLCEIDKQIQLLKELRPVNLMEEMEILKKDTSHNPVFLMPKTGLDLVQMEKELHDIVMK
jgi:alpha-L-glutamate ligase-like protein